MSRESPSQPPLPGGVGLTHLRVYDTPAPDGLHGGGPHVHFACTECYYVEKGRGRVQMLSATGYQEHELLPGKIVWFSPGVIHRLVNEDDRLEIFVVMQNGGLPEAGDFVLTMPAEILQSPEKYFEIASLSGAGEVFTRTEEAAYRRRDLAVEGFGELRRRFEAEGTEALEAFYRMALPLIAPNVEAWQKVWCQGARAAAQATGDQLEALKSGDPSHLLAGAVGSMAPPGSDRKLGMCGTLAAYLPEGKTVATDSLNLEQNTQSTGEEQ